MYVQKISASVTTNTDGAATVYTAIVDYGLLSQIRYVKTDFADGVDFTITVEGTGETLWAQSNVNASATVAPRQATHGTAGVASLYAGSGTAVQDKIAIAKDRIKIVIAEGGSVTSGTFHFLLG